jgi:predicted small lipoprotein YifL
VNSKLASGLLLAAAVTAAFALSGCGRKGPLDPPPMAGLPAPPAYTSQQRSLGEENTFAAPPGERAAARGQAAAQAPPGTPPPQQRSFPLDFLVGK